MVDSTSVPTVPNPDPSRDGNLHTPVHADSRSFSVEHNIPVISWVTANYNFYGTQHGE